MEAADRNNPDKPETDDQHTEPLEDNWRDNLSEELKNSPALKDIKSLESLAKNHVDLQAHLGNMIKKPGEHADEESWGKFREQVFNTDPNLMVKPDLTSSEQSKDFFKSIGVPEAADQYTMPEVGDEEFKPNEEYAKSMMEKAHSLNLTNKQFQDWFESEFNTSVQNLKSLDKMVNDNVTSLKETWGHAFEQNLGEVEGFLVKTGAPEDLVGAVKNQQMSAEAIQYIHNIAMQMVGEKNELTQQRGGARVKTPQELEQDIRDLHKKLDTVQQGSPEATAIGNELVNIHEKLRQARSQH